ncbi:MAG: cysteine hydrolase family protein [Cyclobacteriaceae bacterium]
MSQISDKRPALLLIDIQRGLDDHAFYGGNRNNLDAEKNMATILQKWRDSGLPVYHVHHSSTNPESPLHPSKPGFAVKEGLEPKGDEPCYTKDVNSAFIGTSLEEDLKKAGIDSVVIVGLTTNHCISTSTRMASNLGFKTFLISDATATFDRTALDGSTIPSETIHQSELASLNGEFATVLSTADFLAKA